LQHSLEELTAQMGLLSKENLRLRMDLALHFSERREKCPPSYCLSSESPPYGLSSHSSAPLQLALPPTSVPAPRSVLTERLAVCAEIRDNIERERAGVASPLRPGLPLPSAAASIVAPLPAHRLPLASAAGRAPLGSDMLGSQHTAVAAGHCSGAGTRLSRGGFRSELMTDVSAGSSQACDCGAVFTNDTGRYCPDCGRLRLIRRSEAAVVNHMKGTSVAALATTGLQPARKCLPNPRARSLTPVRTRLGQWTSGRAAATPTEGGSASMPSAARPRASSCAPRMVQSNSAPLLCCEAVPQPMSITALAGAATATVNTTPMQLLSRRSPSPLQHAVPATVHHLIGQADAGTSPGHGSSRGARPSRALVATRLPAGMRCSPFMTQPQVPYHLCWPMGSGTPHAPV